MVEDNYKPSLGKINIIEKEIKTIINNKYKCLP